MSQLPRWLDWVFAAVLAGGLVLMAFREPDRFWQNSWMLALGIAGLAVKHWWIPRK